MIDQIFYHRDWGPDWAETARQLDSGKYTRISGLSYIEYQTRFPADVVEIINRRQINVTIATCCYDVEYTRRVLVDCGVNEHLAKVEPWGTYWFHASYHGLIHNSGPVWCQDRDPEKFIHPFLTFNTRTRPHRTHFIDMLARDNLIKEGIVTYHQLFHEPENNWKYHDGAVLTADREYATSLNYWNPKDIFYNSFLHIPTETDWTAPLISEKTANPMMCKLPFLTLGSRFYHRDVIQDLGFELYDEIFDYTFDSLPSYQDRVEGIISNIKYVVENKHRIGEFYKILQPKINRNFARILNIINNYDLIPDIVKERINAVELGKLEFKFFDDELIKLKRRINGNDELFNNLLKQNG